jgi:dipeptidyl aminopeptidase/acylaminoacyl peptidase
MPYPISRYLNIQSAIAPSFAGDGRSIAFLSDITGIPQVWQVPASPASQPLWPRQLTFGQERVMGVWHAPTGRRLIFARDAGGNENAQLFLLDPDTADVRPLTAGSEGAVHIFGCWSRDGQTIYFAANRRHRAHFDVYRLQLASGATELLWQHDELGFLANFTLAPDGSRLAFTRMASSFAQDLLMLDVESHSVRRLSPSDKPSRYKALAFSPSGHILFVITDLDSDFLHLRRLEPASLTWETLVAPNWDIERMALSRDGRYLVYTVNVDGASRIEWIDMARGAALPGPDLGDVPGVVGDYGITGPDFAPDGKRVVFYYSSATRTKDIILWNLEDGAVHPLTRSGHGGLPVDSFVAPALIHYATFDGRAIPAWFYQPPGGGQDLPVVVRVHSGPESQYRPWFDAVAQYLVNNGYAVLAPNVRGSTGYGKRYSHLDDVTRRLDAVADLAHAAHWLRAQPGIDGKRIAVYGSSYGGFMVLSALTSYPELWAAGIDIAGVSNFVTLLKNTSAYRRGHREAEFGSLERDRDFLESIAPINQVDRMRAPLLVIHGANDPRVPLSEAQQLVAALEARSVPVRFLVFDDEGHGLVRLKNKLEAYPIIVDFLQQHV